LRNKLIPDDYIGDTHLTNWFIKHMGMVTLQKAFVNQKDFIRDELRPDKLNILDFFEIYLVFSSHTVLVTKYYNDKESNGLYFKDLGGNY